MTDGFFDSRLLLEEAGDYWHLHQPLTFVPKAGALIEGQP